ncbi:hypothetical protein FB567DRAFT_520182 [Paraphoma chrysanthemicola]|uniref:Uncharacterized protein n=1 Tax=Paraphoma chrysanthemicola TaxID=798071 RepID=A0A8K0W212_9PLEO|nr:hypothetical protein FB567DRAFT_520182 [Paraphoma chrysanthemicola]
MPPPPTPTQSYAPNPNTAFFNTVLNPHASNIPASATTTTPPRSARPFDAQAQQGVFSAAQRSAQARNKNYNSSLAGSGTASAGIGSAKKEREAESYETRQRREEAGRILESMEMLIWLSNARNESIPQTRHHYRNIVLGIANEDEDVVWKEEWEVDGMQGQAVTSPRSVGKGKERERERERRGKRVSSGTGGHA